MAAGDRQKSVGAALKKMPRLGGGRAGAAMWRRSKRTGNDLTRRFPLIVETLAPLRSPALPCAPLRSPALPCAPLRSPALPCAPLRSPALPCARDSCIIDGEAVACDDNGVASFRSEERRVG